MKEKNELRNIKFSKVYIFLALLIFGIIIYRIGLLALSSEVEGVNLQQMANNRITRRETLESRRGTIYDVNGNALAQNVSSYTLIAYLEESRTTNPENPQHVVNIEYTAEQLSTVLNISKEQFIKYLSRDAYQVEFGSKAKNLSELKKDEIESLNLPGIDFIETQQRYYPYGNFLSYTIGYAKKKEIVKEDGSTELELVGEMGIEKTYNDKLVGENGFTLYQKDRNGYKIAGTNEVTVDAIDGHDIYLTIDSNIQLFVEQAITKMLTECTADWVGIMVADAKTGAILASSTYPSFDPNKKDIVSYLDHNISVAFEPGSTMKIFSYMAAMEAGVYNGSELYKSGIFTAKDGTQIGDHDRRGWGNISYDQGFALSSNVAVMNILDKYLSANELKAYYKKLGFGSKTGIELPNESKGKIEFKYETEILNAGFGQGITTTAIQNIKALTAISNNGVLLQPYIVDKIVDSSTGEIVYKGKKKEIERVASIQTVEKIKELMRSVINGTSSTSTGYYYYMDGYDFIAKTGTAQVANENGTGYTNEIVRGLAGMFPGDDPEVILYLAIKNPTNGTGPTKRLVQEIIKNISKYLEIYEKNTSEELVMDKIKIESYINKDTNSIVSTLKSYGIETVVIGNGNKIISQYPKENAIINKIDKVFLVTNDENITMPNLIGYSTRDFHSLMSLLNIKYHTIGHGFLITQSIPPDTPINKDTYLDVTFESKY